MSEIFMLAARQKLRFPSCRGPLTAEQLWDMPLQSKSVPEFSLDDVAKQVNRDLKSTAEQSFVSPDLGGENTKLTLMLDVVKFVIATKVAENATTANRVANAQERQKLLGILADKQDEALKSMTPEQIQARLATLAA